MTVLVISPAARRDLTDIWLYTADRWGMGQADAYTSQIESIIACALKRPDIGGAVNGLPPAFRKLKSGSHRIIYRLVRHEMIIVRILHERQDVPNEIEDDE